MALEMMTRSFADTRIVECSGRIVLGDESANFRDLVKDLLTKCKQIVLDLGGVTYIDSIGLGVLVGLLISAQKAGGDIKLANLKPRLIDGNQADDVLRDFRPGRRCRPVVQSHDGRSESQLIHAVVETLHF